MKLVRVNEFLWKLDKSGSMQAPVHIYASDSLIKKMKVDRTLKQAIDVASFPGVISPVIVMPDGHEGYGFPIGGVAAFPADGLVSPGGIGYDINCGMRLLVTGLDYDDVKPRIGNLVSSLFKAVPSGVGSKGFLNMSMEEFIESVTQGVKWAVKEGYATKHDAEHMEERGSMQTSHDSVSQKALSRGIKQLGTLGAGNHFLEIQRVTEKSPVAKTFGLRENQVVVMIHTGSRGFGHQIASDHISKLISSQPHQVSKELTAAPINSQDGQDYLEAMKCAVNFAFVNRQIITHYVRQVFNEFFGATPELMYDVAHNIGKFEKHEDTVFVHRKGATRAFGPGRKGLPRDYASTGQPVIIPGSMGTASYVLVGKGDPNTFESTCHGAGRVMSRSAARRNLSGNVIRSGLAAKGIEIKAKAPSLVVEEAPEAYKDIDEVVSIVEMAGISDVAARLLPMGVVKG